ncbi:MAG: hypothetical protein ACRCUF_02975 [Aeromonas sobria]
MKLKSLFAAAVLMFSTMAHADWAPSIADQTVYARQSSANGESSTVSVHLNGGFMIGSYPAGWDGTGSDKEVGRGNTVLNVNGQAVKFLVTKDEDGAIYMWATTYKGQKYIKEQLWNKARLTFINQQGNRFVLSAKGFQQAWSFMTVNQGI